MKQIKLPFEIGKEYENWEFDLEILDVARIKGYDSYTYLKKIEFLNKVPSYTELVFSWDILQAVVIMINFDSTGEFKEFKEIINKQLGEKKESKLGLNGNIFFTLDNIKLLFTNPIEARVLIIYGRNDSHLSSIYNSLLS